MKSLRSGREEHAKHVSLFSFKTATFYPLNISYNSQKNTSASQSQMASRIFALIIGIDSYRSGGIWNLHACVEDAKRMKRYLINDLNVPQDQIRLLLDRQATKQAIEDAFMDHLTNNAAIDRGDAMIIYFAGHGSSIPAPSGWFQEQCQPVSETVQVLCPYDHEMKQPGGRICGISDRSVHALLRGLSQAKGDNITFIADCCFSPSQTPSNIRDRSRIRWTPTAKATANDLYLNLWPGARGWTHTQCRGFYDANTNSHIFLSACGSDGKAVEGKDGGRFTSKLLQASAELALHRTSYDVLADYLYQKMVPEGQQPMCLGLHKTRIVFDGVPFSVDANYILARSGHYPRLRIEVGAIQGVVEGSEFSIHLHNYRCSKNPKLAAVVASEVHPTWSLCDFRCSNMTVPEMTWARITRWNNRRPFRVHLRSTLVSLYRRWKLHRVIPTKPGDTPSKAGLNIIRVKNAAQADISLKISFRDQTIEIHDIYNAVTHPRVTQIDKREILDIIDDAARFYMHFHRKNPEYPLWGLVTMELFRLDPLSWTSIGSNLLENGKTTISCDSGSIFTVIINNKSDMDLWPYLFFMDPSTFGITMLYCPDHSSGIAPLPKHGRLQIGSGHLGSEALSFVLPDQNHFNSGLLKLFLAPKPVSVGMIEQAPAPNGLVSLFESHRLPPLKNTPDQMWDTISAYMHFIRPY